MSELDQRITGFDVWHLALPVASARDHGVGRVEGTCEIVVLRLTTEGGVQGFGEASPWSVFTGSPEASYAALDRYIRPYVLGRSLSDHTAIMRDAARAIAYCTEAKAALETALFDLAGRVEGVPIHMLMGGRMQETVPLSVSIANPDFDADKDLLSRITDDGVGIVKLKTGFKDHAFDLMRLEYLASDYPTLKVRVDYNQGLEPDAAKARVVDIARFRPDFIEQPVRATEYDLMAEIRAAIDVPLLADESVFGPEDMTRAIREGICDGVSVKIMKTGGLTRAQQVAQRAAGAGLTAYGGDMFESGLAHLAGLHMIAATPEITLGCEFYQAQYFLIEDLLEEPFRHEHGALRVPDTPGLGGKPDLERLMRYRVSA